MMRNWFCLPAILASIATVFAMTPVLARPAPTRQCFDTSEFDNWRAGDAKTIYIHVRPNNYFRLDLSGRCSTLLSPGAQLITTFRGTSLICSPLDWDLKVSAGIGGNTEPCLVRTMTKLTQEEVTALPKKAKP